MDKIDLRYQRGKIYTIRCYDDETLIYVGSTIETLSARMSKHRSHKCSLYKYVNGNWKNWYIELYEEYPCNNKQLLEKREGEVIRLIGNINKRIEGRTDKERRNDNKEQILEKEKKYRNDNKDKILEKAKQYRNDNKEKIKEQRKEYDKKYREANKNKINEKIKEYKKQYREANKNKIKEQRKEYDKKYHNNNKEKIAEKKKEKVICDHCGSEIRKDGLSPHKKTNKCKNYNITKE